VFLFLGGIREMHRHFVSEERIDFFEGESLGLAPPDKKNVSAYRRTFGPGSFGGLPPHTTYLGTPEIENQHVDERQADEDNVIAPLDVGQRRGSRFHIHQCGQECSCK
jgi:hypothetical protein